MFSKLFHSKAVGFSLKEDLIHYAVASFYQNKIRIHQADSFHIESKAALHKFQSYLKLYPAAVCHCPSSILIKSLIDQKIPQKDKQKILNYQMESISLNDPVIFNETPNKSTLIAVKENSVKELKEKLKALEFKAQKTILRPLAIAFLSNLTNKDYAAKVILFFSFSSVDFIFTNQDQLQHYSSFDCSFHTPEQIALKILRLIFVISESKPMIKHIEIGGLFDQHHEIIQILQTHAGYDLPKKINSCVEPQYHSYLPEIGLALNVLNSSDVGLNKINTLDLYQIFRKKIKVHLSLIGTIALLCLLFWHMKFSQIKNSNQQLLVQNLTILGLNEDKPLKFSFDQLTKLKNKIGEIQKKYPPFSYQADVPTVSEVLLYLSELNQTLHLKENASSFIIEDFKYHLISFPTIKSPNIPYKVQVTFSFSTDSSLTARKIHESLLKAKSIIDINKKVDWSYQNNCYKVSFYLKNLSPAKLYD